MKDFIEKNKRYIVYIIFGIMLMALPSAFSMENKSGSSEEASFAEFLERTEGVGKAKVMLNKRDNGDVSGVIIAARGAENSNVRKNIIEAAETVFGVSAHQVKVFKYSEEVK